MKSLSILLLFITIYSCATVPNKVQEPINITIETAKCNNGDGFACSLLAYYYRIKKDPQKELIFNQKGCDLKEESACFNLKQLDEFKGYLKTVWFRVNFYSDQIAACYKPRVGHRIPRREIDTKIIIVTTNFHVNVKGAPEKVAVSLQNMKDLDFKKCAENIIKKIKFPPPSQGDQRDFSLESHFRYDE